MKPVLPPALRAVAGLAAVTLDEARRLPNRLVSLPVVTAGAAMQASLRLQQEYAGLVARGDELILQLRGHTGEAPGWATFDEDAPSTDDGATSKPAGGGSAVEPLLSPPGAEPSAFDTADRPTSFDPAQARDGHPASAAPDPLGLPDDAVVVVSTEDLLEATRPPTPTAASPVPGYDGWTVAQLRARLRRLSTAQLTDLLEYERASRERAPYVSMLRNRLTATSLS